MFGRKIFFWVKIGAIDNELKARRSLGENQSLTFGLFERFISFSFFSSDLQVLFFFSFGSLMFRVFFEQMVELSLLSSNFLTFGVIFSPIFASSKF